MVYLTQRERSDADGDEERDEARIKRVELHRWRYAARLSAARRRDVVQQHWRRAQRYVKSHFSFSQRYIPYLLN